ncbi:MAG: RHS repeat-associated core domain-containing protein [Terracidiphilus sp.]|jgi:RHS repeat-associated protein
MDNAIVWRAASLFTGKERDSESGNDYFPARYYASSMGRWMSPDPSGLFFADPGNPQGLNLYSYVQNRPLSFVDPDGLDGVVPPRKCADLGCLLHDFWDSLKGLFSGGSGGGGGGCPPGEVCSSGGGGVGWSTRTPTSGHYFDVVLHPSGALWNGHMGDAVDSQDSNGWATAANFTPLDRVGVLVGIPFAGLERPDSITYSKYASKTSGIGHPLHLYYPIDEATYQSINDRIQMRYDPHYGQQHKYWLYLNSCGQEVGDDIRAAHIPGAPPRWLFSPWLDYLWLRAQTH